MPAVRDARDTAERAAARDVLAVASTAEPAPTDPSRGQHHRFLIDTASS